jgi:membrane protein implicated in regulation of membrane protease activity
MMLKKPNSDRLLKSIFPGVIVLWIGYAKVELAPYLQTGLPFWMHLVPFALALFATVLVYHIIED